MPLARILTFAPDEAVPLFRQLEQMGFAVEIANPNEEKRAPADLEIEFAICDQQQALARAAAIAAQLQAEVVVFPRALPPLPKPAPVITEAPIVGPPERHLVSSPQEASESAHSRADREFALQVAAESWFEAGAEKLGAIGANLRIRLQRLQPVLQTGLTKVKSGVSAAGSAIAVRARAYQEHIKLRAAEIRVNRKQRLAEIERQHTGVAQHPGMPQESAPTTPNFQGLEHLQIAQAERQKRLAEMERLRSEAREQVAALERARLAAEAAREQLERQAYEEPVRRRELKTFRPGSSQLRGVFTGAAAASILFIAGILFANFHASTPLPATMTNGSVEQQAPFGGVTVHGAPGVTLGGVKTSRPAPPVKNIQPAAQPQAKPQPAKASPVERKKSQWRRFHQKSSRAEDDVVADDVVVRHLGPAQKPVQKNTQQQAGLKHYSDQ